MPTNPSKYKKTDPAIIKRAKTLRQPLTPPEHKLWQRLRNRQLYGLKFRRQHPLGHFILDFYCHEHRLGFELDGPSHFNPTQQRYDQARTAWLEQQGVRLIRFTNHQVETNVDGVLAEIARQCGVTPSPSPLGAGSKASPTQTEGPCEGIL